MAQAQVSGLQEALRRVSPAPVGRPRCCASVHAWRRAMLGQFPQVLLPQRQPAALILPGNLQAPLPGCAVCL